MQIRGEGLPLAGESRVPSDIEPDFERGLIKEIQPLVDPYGISAGALGAALKEAVQEIDPKTSDTSANAIRSCLIELVLSKLFARGNALWINVETAAGNAVPLELRVAAYSVWNNAASLAARQGVDDAAAAEILIQATCNVADRIAKGPGKGQIRDIRKYLFACYMHLIPEIAERRGSRETNYVDLEQWIANREFSDQEMFLGGLESGILCRELLEAMPPRGRSVAVARYVFGYSWTETAESLGTSVNAAQKALSVGVRSAFGECMQQLRRLGYRRISDIEKHLMNNKKSRLRKLVD